MKKQFSRAVLLRFMSEEEVNALEVKYDELKQRFGHPVAITYGEEEIESFIHMCKENLSISRMAKLTGMSQSKLYGRYIAIAKDLVNGKLVLADRMKPSTVLVDSESSS